MSLSLLDATWTTVDQDASTLLDGALSIPKLLENMLAVAGEIKACENSQ